MMMSETPGKFLLAAREAKSLSREEVAKQIRLSVSVIEDIESDHYEHFGAATFVRGYLRSYARVVGVSEEKVLLLWEATGSQVRLSTPAPLMVEGISNSASHCQSDGCVNVPSRSVVVMGALVVLGVITWSLNQKPEAPVIHAASLAPKTQVMMPAIAMVSPKSEPLSSTQVVQPAAKMAQPVPSEKQTVVSHHHHKPKNAEPLHVTYTVKPVSAEELASDH
jgi:cytoskeleton protein RodZ